LRLSSASLELINNLGEDIANRRAKDGQNRNNDNRNQDQDERVLNQTLTFFSW
jgi:hypothetical protein